MSIVENMTPDEKMTYEKYKDIFPFPLVNFAKDLGIEVYAMDNFPSNKSGAITYEQGKYVILLNDKHSPKRKRFTLAHEIGHFINDKSYLAQNKEIVDTSKQANRVLFRPDSPCCDPQMRQMDILANRFAAELLMPEDEFIKKWRELSSPEDVAEYFNVSTDATKIRASQVCGEIV